MARPLSGRHEIPDGNFEEEPGALFSLGRGQAPVSQRR
jgi:hypothetical protein